MWQQLRVWLTAIAVAAVAMLLLLLAVGQLTSSPDAFVTEEDEASDAPFGSDEHSCKFRVSGTVTNQSGDPIESVTFSLKGDGPFALADRVAETNSSGRFLYLESGYGTCFLEELFPRISDPSNEYREWSRSKPVENGEEFRVTLSANDIR